MTKQRCLARVGPHGDGRQCARYAAFYGSCGDYCYQHNPDKITERKAEQDRRAEWARNNSPIRRLKRVNIELLRLREALERIANSGIECYRHSAWIADIAREALEKDDE
jgi:hypothetical protein